ncbi:MAG: hypothetical protein WBM44_31275 [Waterburya sp.]
MTELLEKAIAELKKLSDKQQNEVAVMILKQIQPSNKLFALWQKVDELGTDEDEPTMAETTAMVKEIRQRQSYI